MSAICDEELQDSMKTVTDPFRIYGIEDNEAPEDIEGHDLATRAFLQQEIFSQREKFFAELDSVADVAPNIEDFVKMVEKENSREKNSNASVKTNRKAYVSTADQIRTGLAHVDVTFSRIFQALLVLIDNPTSSSNSARAGSPEKERVSRRSREFNVRLKRIAFELKQKVGQTRSALMKLKIRPESVKLREATEIKLYQSIRCTLTLLNSYLGHLPHSVPAFIFPEALKSAIEGMTAVVAFTERLNFDAGEFGNDLKRLQAASERSGKVERDKGNIFQEGSVTKQHRASSIKNVPGTFTIINNLAREKFGIAPKSALTKKLIESSPSKSSDTSPKKSNLKRASLLLSPKIVPEDQITVLDLADDELSHILACRFNGMSRETVDLSTHPVSYAADLTTKIVEDLVATVCGEMFLDEVVEKILKFELRG